MFVSLDVDLFSSYYVVWSHVFCLLTYHKVIVRKGSVEARAASYSLC